MKNLSIIMPCYNEEKYLRKIFEEIKKLNLKDSELIIVNDGSKDKTLEIAKELASNNDWIKIVSHPDNRGKGFAIREGFKVSDGRIIVVQDADLEYEPSEIIKVIEPIESGKAKVVYGSRFLKRFWPREMKLLYWLANKILTCFARFLFCAKITDEATCYKAFDREIFKNLNIQAVRFEFCCEVTAKVLRQKLAIHEVAVSYKARSVKEGKKIGIKDFFSSVWTLIKYRFKN